MQCNILHKISQSHHAIKSFCFQFITLHNNIATMILNPNATPFFITWCSENTGPESKEQTAPIVPLPDGLLETLEKLYHPRFQKVELGNHLYPLVYEVMRSHPTFCFLCCLFVGSQNYYYCSQCADSASQRHNRAVSVITILMLPWRTSHALPVLQL